MEKASVISNEIELTSPKDEGIIFETPDYNSERVNSNDFLGGNPIPIGSNGIPRYLPKTKGSDLRGNTCCSPISEKLLNGIHNR
jgi:hypothetical protein